MIQDFTWISPFKKACNYASLGINWNLSNQNSNKKIPT